MVLAEGSTPDEAVNLSLITRPLLDGGLGGVERARLDWDFKPEYGHGEQRDRTGLWVLFSSNEIHVHVYFGSKYRGLKQPRTYLLCQYYTCQNSAMCLLDTETDPRTDKTWPSHSIVADALLFIHLFGAFYLWVNNIHISLYWSNVDVVCGVRLRGGLLSEECMFTLRYLKHTTVPEATTTL